MGVALHAAISQSGHKHPSNGMIEALLLNEHQTPCCYFKDMQHNSDKK